MRSIVVSSVERSVTADDVFEVWQRSETAYNRENHSNTLCYNPHHVWPELQTDSSVLVVFVLLLFAATQYIPPYVSAFQFNDFIRQEVKFAAPSRRTTDDVRTSIVQKAKEFDIPLDAARHPDHAARTFIHARISNIAGRSI